MTLPISGPGLVDALNRHRDELQRINSFSHRNSGTTSYLRFEASRSTAFVQVHVQHTGAGGGGATYNAATYVSSTETDCRDQTAPIKDTTVTRNGTDNYYVWLIPVYKDLDGNAVKFDGQSGRPDYMAYLDLGV